MSAAAVKICGIRTADDALCAARAGADYLGFVFYRKSPQFIEPESAEEIVMELKQASFDEGFNLPKLVGLFLDAGEKEMSETAPFLTHFQFHGHESPGRCFEMSSEFAVDIIKAMSLSAMSDLPTVHAFADAVDIVLFDAKAPAGAARTVGESAAFYLKILEDYTHDTPFLLAGGLDAENVAATIAAQKSAAFLGVDVSSGVESSNGKKDPELIKAFISAAKNDA